MKNKLIVEIVGQIHLIVLSDNYVVSVKSYLNDKNILDILYSCCKQMDIASITFIVDSMYSRSASLEGFCLKLSDHIFGYTSFETVKKLLKIIDNLQIRDVKFVDRLAIIVHSFESSNVAKSMLILDQVDSAYKVIVCINGIISDVISCSKESVQRSIEFTTGKFGIHDVISFYDILNLYDFGRIQNKEVLPEETFNIVKIGAFSMEYCGIGSHSLKESEVDDIFKFSEKEKKQDVFIGEASEESPVEKVVSEAARKMTNKQNKRRNSQGKQITKIPRKNKKPDEVEEELEEEIDRPNKSGKFGAILLILSALFLVTTAVSFVGDTYFSKNLEKFVVSSDDLKSNYLSMKQYRDSLMEQDDGDSTSVVKITLEIFNNIGAKNLVSLRMENDDYIVEFRAKNEEQALEIVRNMENLKLVSDSLKNKKNVFTARLTKFSL